MPVGRLSGKNYHLIQTVLAATDEFGVAYPQPKKTMTARHQYSIERQQMKSFGSPNDNLLVGADLPGLAAMKKMREEWVARVISLHSVVATVASKRYHKLRFVEAIQLQQSLDTSVIWLAASIRGWHVRHLPRITKHNNVPNILNVGDTAVMMYFVWFKIVESLPSFNEIFVILKR